MTSLIPQLKTQADAVIYFIQQMDIVMVNDILDENRTYQGFEKHVFIEKLGIAFNEFRKEGNTFLDRHDGSCCGSNCENFKNTGVLFSGNNSKFYFSLIFKIKDGMILDIFECHLFCSSMKLDSEWWTVNIDRSLSDCDFPF